MATFATDQDLLRYEPELDVYLPSTQADYTPQNIAAGDVIIDDLKRKNMIKDEAQILEPTQLKQAAIFQALSIIFNFLSANAEDKFMAKSFTYKEKYDEEFAQLMMSITIDSNEDGSASEDEKNQSFQPRLERW